MFTFPIPRSTLRDHRHLAGSLLHLYREVREQTLLMHSGHCCYKRHRHLHLRWQQSSLRDTTVCCADNMLDLCQHAPASLSQVFQLQLWQKGWFSEGRRARAKEINTGDSFQGWRMCVMQHAFVWFQSYW